MKMNSKSIGEKSEMANGDSIDERKEIGEFFFVWRCLQSSLIDSIENLANEEIEEFLFQLVNRINELRSYFKKHNYSNL